MFNREFFTALAERALTTAAQAWFLYAGFSEGGPFNAFNFDWAESAGFALGGAVLSAIKGIAVNGVTKRGPGIGGAEVVK